MGTVPMINRGEVSQNMQDTEYGPDPDDIRVFDFGDSTLRDIESAVSIHDEVVGENWFAGAKMHLAEAAYNARKQDKLLGLEEDKLSDIHDILRGIGTLRISGYEFQNSTFQRLADDFERQMSRAELASEVGSDNVATEEY